MTSNVPHQNYIQDTVPAFPPQYGVEQKGPCPQCPQCPQCHNRDSRIYPHQRVHPHCIRQTACECGYSSCQRQQSCFQDFSEIQHPVVQPCSCQAPPDGYRTSNCSCPRQQQQQQPQPQQSAFTPTPVYPQSPYPILPVHHLPPAAVPFNPIPVASPLAIPPMIHALHGQQESLPSRIDETYYQRHPVNSGSSLEDSSHYHTHIHHHIHRYQHYPFSCVSIGHHHVPSVTVPSHTSQSRHHWRHVASRATTAPYPYLHVPFHYHPYRVLPTSSMQRTAVTPVFYTGTVEIDHEDANYEWNGVENQSAEPRGLSKLDIEQLPSYSYKEDSDRSTENKRCVVCISDFEEDENLRALPCSHEFHSKCVDKWLKSNPTCPICRAIVHVPS